MSQQLNQLRKIQELKFSVLEFNLYLNTHPKDQVALKQYNQLTQKLISLRTSYQKKYGPLTTEFPSDFPWQYPKTPWPWQIQY